MQVLDTDEAVGKRFYSSGGRWVLHMSAHTGGAWKLQVAEEDAALDEAASWTDVSDVEFTTRDAVAFWMSPNLMHRLAGGVLGGAAHVHPADEYAGQPGDRLGVAMGLRLDGGSPGGGGSVEYVDVIPDFADSAPETFYVSPIAVGFQGMVETPAVERDGVWQDLAAAGYIEEHNGVGAFPAPTANADYGYDYATGHWRRDSSIGNPAVPTWVDESLVDFLRLGNYLSGGRDANGRWMRTTANADGSQTAIDDTAHYATDEAALAWFDNHDYEANGLYGYFNTATNQVRRLTEYTAPQDAGTEPGMVQLTGSAASSVASALASLALPAPTEDTIGQVRSHNGRLFVGDSKDHDGSTKDVTWEEFDLDDDVSALWNEDAGTYRWRGPYLRGGQVTNPASGDVILLPNDSFEHYTTAPFIGWLHLPPPGNYRGKQLSETRADQAARAVGDVAAWAHTIARVSAYVAGQAEYTTYFWSGYEAPARPAIEIGTFTVTANDRSATNNNKWLATGIIIPQVHRLVLNFGRIQSTQGASINAYPEAEDHDISWRRWKNLDPAVAGAGVGDGEGLNFPNIGANGGHELAIGRTANDELLVASSVAQSSFPGNPLTLQGRI